MAEIATTMSGVPREEVWAILQVAMVPVSCGITLYAADKLGWMTGASARVGTAVATTVERVVEPVQLVYNWTRRSQGNSNAIAADDLETGTHAMTGVDAVEGTQAVVPGDVVRPVEMVPGLVTGTAQHKAAANVNVIAALLNTAPAADAVGAQLDRERTRATTDPMRPIIQDESDISRLNVGPARMELPNVPEVEPTRPLPACLARGDHLAMLTE